MFLVVMVVGDWRRRRRGREVVWRLRIIVVVVVVVLPWLLGVVGGRGEVVMLVSTRYGLELGLALAYPKTGYYSVRW